MSGPHISIVPADTEKTISFTPNVGIPDIRVSSEAKKHSQRRQKVQRKKPVFHDMNDDDDDDDTSIQFGKTSKPNKSQSIKRK